MGLNGVTALAAVAVLLVHALVMGWHVPPQLRALAGLDSGLCHAAARGNDAPTHPGPDHPGAPSDHLAHCPICLSVDGGKLLAPPGGPIPAPPVAVATLVFGTATPSARPSGSAHAFHARAPPVAT